MENKHRNFSFNYIIKPVGENCNNACTYCYYVQNRFNQVVIRNKMSLRLAKKIIKNIAEYEMENKHAKVELIWHGGEPLLAGIDFYHRVFLYQKRFPITFRNVFQTNGILITQEWCDFFKQNDCNIGFSLDGPPEINDQQRKSRNGRGTTSNVLKGINLCLKNGVGIGGLLCVVSDMSSKYPEKILNFFYSKGLKTVDFLAVHNIDNETATEIASYNLRPEKFSIFMKKVFDWYLKMNDPDVEIRTISNVLSRLFGGKATVCHMQGIVCGTFLTIYSDGRVLFCDDYNCGQTAEIGNIKKETISQIARSDIFNSMIYRTKGRLNRCKDCEVVTICNGGCPRDWNENGSYFCAYYKDFYYYCYEKIINILQNVSN